MPRHRDPPSQLLVLPLSNGRIASRTPLLNPMLVDAPRFCSSEGITAYHTTRLGGNPDEWEAKNVEEGVLDRLELSHHPVKAVAGTD